MWFGRREVDPEIGAVMHWLGQRGLVARDGLDPATWAKAARGTDYRDLALATKGGLPCAVPSHLYVYGGAGVETAAGDMADRLELPLDEIVAEDGLTRVRSGARWDTYEGEGLALLLAIASDWVDAHHTLVTDGPRVALVHRDIEDEARAVIAALPLG